MKKKTTTKLSWYIIKMSSKREDYSHKRLHLQQNIEEMNGLMIQLMNLKKKTITIQIQT